MLELTSKEITIALKTLGSAEKAKASAWFFKTGPGQYAEGDRFIGVTVPEVRSIVKNFKTLPLSETQKLLSSPLHEERLTALLILVEQYKKADDFEKKTIVDLYLASTASINNWDLVDSSAPPILGAYLWKRSKKLLTELAQSKNLWERRIAMISTFYFIRQGESEDALKIAKIVLSDSHDLMHKAIGWMLREVGKNCGEEILKEFLKKNYEKLPRTTLRYAIERFPERERKAWLKGPFDPAHLQETK